jgi:putative endonuclease
VNCFVYVLRSIDDGPIKTYVGWTNDLDKRLRRHNEGLGARSTRGRTWELIYVERYLTRGDAMSREWHLKRDRGLRARLRSSAAQPNGVRP